MERTMKESGIEWVGIIPESWNVLRNKNCFVLEKNIVGDEFEQYDLLSLTKKGIVKKSKDNAFGKTPESYSTYQSVKKGQIVMCLFDLDMSAVFSGLSDYDGMISPAYKTYNCNSNILNSFAKYWFEYCFDGRKYKIYSKSLRYVVNADDFGSIKIVVPPMEEQEKIVAFLDDRIKEIDAVILQTKESIDEYKKYKQSVMTEAITQGLDKSVEIVDTDNVHISKIPVHWNMKRIKYIFEIKKDIAGKEGYDILSITQKGIKIKDISKNEGQVAQDYSNYQLVDIGDFAMNHMDLLTGWVDISPYAGVTSPDYRVFRFIDATGYDADYYLYLMQMCYMNRIFYGLGQGVSNLGRWRLQADKFLNFTIPEPPLEEQQKIAKYLSARCTEIDALIAKKESFVDEMETYKKSLIYEYVTGKKEVK